MGESQRQETELIIMNNVLHRKTQDADGHAFTQIVVPTNRKNEIIKIAHSTPMAGHLGHRATLSKIHRNFYWPGMSEQVKQACRRCERCQKTGKKANSTAPMVTTPTFVQPFHRVAMDVVGLLPLTKRKNMFILTYLDLATRYPEAVPLRETSAKTVAEAL